MLCNGRLRVARDNNHFFEDMMVKLNKLLGAMVFSGALAAQAASITFTTCGATGDLGPTQANCNAAYAAGGPTVVVAAGIQTWTVPVSGIYRITATGAQGASGDAAYVGGRGARVAGSFSLSAGQTIKLAVGQAGSGQSSGNNGGGGGGSFVVSSADVPMLIAGGGGGTRTSVLQNGCDASITQYGVIGSGGSQTSACTVKATDLGLGGIVSSGSWGSGGGGFNGNGAADPSQCSGFSALSGGHSWLNGMGGGRNPGGGTSMGGFGGGGEGQGCWGGGGGGGYSGGDGGRVAGGGGSYNAGTGPAATAGVGVGAGSIVIDVPTAIPTLSEWGMILLAGLLGLGAMVSIRRQRR